MARNEVVVPLLPGFEEIEAVTIIDVLRRAEVPVAIASESPGPVEGAHGIVVHADVALSELDLDAVGMVVLPGGMPGAKHLAQSAEVQRLLDAVRAADGYTAAICAAPMALAAAGIHRGKTVTSYPGFDSHLEGATYVDDRVVVDGRVVTSRGPGTALEFALTLVELLAGKQAERTLAQRMLVERNTGARRV